MPIYSSHTEDHDSNETYLVLALTSLNSYFEHQNQYPLWVTTNNKKLFATLLSFQKISGYQFNIEFVTPKELHELFRLDAHIENDPIVCKLFYSKFMPVLKRHADQMIHVDYDTLFLRQVDFSTLLKRSLNLVKHSNLGPYSINSGVFGIQEHGFDLCQKKIIEPLNLMPFSNGVQTNDEEAMEKLLFCYEHFIHITDQPWLNCLAYDLALYPDWREKVEIIHFHWFKPFNFILEASGELTQHMHMHQPPTDLTSYTHRLNDDFYEAIKRWHMQLHRLYRIFPDPCLDKFIRLAAL